MLVSRRYSLRVPGIIIDRSANAAGRVSVADFAMLISGFPSIGFPPLDCANQFLIRFLLFLGELPKAAPLNFGVRDDKEQCCRFRHSYRIGHSSHRSVEEKNGPDSGETNRFPSPRRTSAQSESRDCPANVVLGFGTAPLALFDETDFCVGDVGFQ